MLEARESYSNISFDARESVRDFSKTITVEGINEIVSRYKRSSESHTASFSVMPVLQPGRHRHLDYGEPFNKQRKFFIDGDLGLLLLGQLQIRKNERIALAEVSFSLRPLTEYPDIADFDLRRYPRIVQMQGCTYEGDRKSRREQALKMLQAIRMERVLIDLTIEYAYMYDLPAVGILPASANLNRDKNGFNMEAMKRRYDTSAKRSGFIRQPSGLYIRELNLNSFCLHSQMPYSHTLYNINNPFQP